MIASADRQEAIRCHHWCCSLTESACQDKRCHAASATHAQSDARLSVQAEDPYVHLTNRAVQKRLEAQAAV